MPLNFNLFQHYDIESIILVERFANLYEKLHRNRINLYFNRTCKRNKIIPKYINIYTNDTSPIAQTAKQTAEKAWLSNIIKELYTKINLLTIKTYDAQLEISSRFHRLEYENILEQVEYRTEIILRTKRETIKKKLDKLIRNKHTATEINTASMSNEIKHKFYKRTCNLTNIALNDQEQKVLNFGLKHNVSSGCTLNNINKQLLNVENAILRTNTEYQDEIRSIFINEYLRQNVQTLNNNRQFLMLKTIKEIKNKLKNNDAQIIKADKGNTMVIMYKDEYNRKMDEYIANNNIEKLLNDPTKLFLKNINNVINQSTKLLTRKQIFNFKMIKPTAPMMNGLPKIHKENTPMRPLINFTTSPTYNIAKWLNQWLTLNIKMDVNYSVKNNLELIDKIQSINIPNGAKLASFDVTNMYSNIPVEETIKITTELLLHNNIDTETVLQVNRLLKNITEQNYFQHNNEFYSQNDGLPMGSPLSGTLANIYMNYIENKYIINVKNRHKQNIIYWYRYVDDILILYRGSIRQLELLHQYINNIHENIKFTLEVESESSINFLDLNIKIENQKHRFKIFRKPTQTNHTIHCKSDHPYQQKMAAFNHMLNRLNRVPMNEEDYMEELKIIKYIAKENGYNPNSINYINYKIKNKMNLQRLTTLNMGVNEPKKYIPLEYDSITNKIMKRVLIRYGYTTAFRTNNKLNKKLSIKRNDVLDTGVYKLICNDCPKFYIGQTGRSFAQRFKEHTNEVNHNINTINIKSNYAQHIVNDNHSYTNINTNLKILHQTKKGDVMNRLEEIEIYKNRHNPLLLNNKINTKRNRIYELVINNSRRNI